MPNIMKGHLILPLTPSNWKPFFCPWFSNARENKYSKRLADYKQLDVSINSVQFFSDLNTMKNQGTRSKNRR